MTFTYRHKKELIMGLIILIIISISIFLIIKYRPKPKKESKKETIEKNIVEEKVKEEKAKEEKEEEYKVDIKGAVITPGLYSLPKSSRVIDVINKAGGLKDEKERKQTKEDGCPRRLYADGRYDDASDHILYALYVVG